MIQIYNYVIWTLTLKNHVCNLHGGHTTPASSEWEQLRRTPIPLWLQLRREDSVPVHPTSSRSIGPVPRPNVAEDIATGSTENHHLYISRYSCLINMPEYISKVAMCTWLLVKCTTTSALRLTLYKLVPDPENPSCLHTTLASLLSHPSSHTVPHTLLIQISTLPALCKGPLTKRTVPLVQCWAAAFTRK